MTVTKFNIKRRTVDEVWDVRSMVLSPKWTTDTNFQAGELTFDLLMNNSIFVPKMGDVVSFSWNGKNIFMGYIFSADYSKDGQTITCTAYDKLRYLKNQDSIVWPVSNLSQRFERVTKAAGITHKVINNSTYKLKTEVADQKTYFDMLQSAIEKVLSATGVRYYIRDNFGTVELLKSQQTQTDLVLGDASLMTDFSYTQSIDQAANAIKVIREDKHSKKRKVVTYDAKTHKKNTRTETTSWTTNTTKQVDSGDHIKQWGRLQLVEKADNDLNDAQMLTKAKQLLKENNKVSQTLKLTAIGVLGIRAGTSFYFRSQELKSFGFGQKLVFPTKVTHNFSETDWTMEIEVLI
ncbi:hypothetical protein FE410_05260 [Leuconostoc carnosum]|uniref:XkdQ/YqbQ family protein n=1 Tax=Leuconostoc TaxID=1243 RepID=UPI001239A05A|nr:hypothetical protein [Leuconostoc carnosum]KAA8371099.1 hypothetical protein FE414_05255 [Leuconostoc carnosum]KAA8382740.1 hypothetical protein FE410_05260 [Leuconostoc carnosum]